MKIRLLALGLITVISSCKKDEVESTPVKFSAASGLYISSEGNFQSANSTITYYNQGSNGAVSDVFEKVNGHSPGDITQSMSVINDKLYIVVNNSGKIEVCNLNSMAHIATISGLTSPRYIFQVNNQKAYISDLAANQISVVDLVSNTVSSTIQLNGWAEQMIMEGNRVFVTNVFSDYLYVIDSSTDQVSDSILISKGAASITKDKNGKLWVLCGSDYLGTYTGALHRIAAANDSVEMSLLFSLPDNPFDLCINNAKDSLYFINNNVYKMGIDAVTLPATAFVTSNSNSYYCVAVDPSNDEVYVSDAIDYIQNGRIYRYNSTGTLVASFLAGIAPGDFLFF